jgi:hypothetical protein
MRILQQGTHQLPGVHVRRVVLLNYFFAPRIASFATLKTRNLITVFAEILNLLLRLSIKACASFPLLFYELPNPGRTNPPSFLAALQAMVLSASRNTAAVFLSV